MITTQEALNRLIDNNELFYDEMVFIMREIMSGNIAPEVISALLIGLRIKVETVSEISAAASVMQEFSTPVPIKNKENLVDIVGTGGDKAHTFNISSTAMFVASAAGSKIAKHGGRAVSSSSGAADIMEKMGVSLNLNAEQVASCIDKIGLGFMFAPNHHIAMKYVAPVRKALGVRTIFNILGPLTNPAGAKNQLIGVFHPDLVGIIANVCRQMKQQHVMVVNGWDGLDEITLTGRTHVAELKDNKIINYDIKPQDFGLKMIDDLKPLQALTAQDSLDKMNSVLAGESGPCRDIVLLNAGAAIYCANTVATLADGIEAAKEAIDTGKAQAKQLELIQLTQAMANEQ